MKRVFIFGVNGFVGRYLAEELASHGYQVFGSDLQENTALNISYLPADFTKAEAVEEVIKRVNPQFIVSLCAVSSVSVSWKNPAQTVGVNVVGVINLLEAVKNHCPNCRVLLVGSSEEYAESDSALKENSPLNAQNPYGISKLAQEQFAILYRKNYDLNIVCVRAFNHTGVGQREMFALPSFCKQVAQIAKGVQSGVIRVGNLAVSRDFSHVSDVVCAYRLILERGTEEVYNVGYGEAYSLMELLLYIISLSGKKIQIEVEREKLRKGEIACIKCDNTRLKTSLGWTPKFTVYDALKELYEAYLREENI